MRALYMMMIRDDCVHSTEKHESTILKIRTHKHCRRAVEKKRRAFYNYRRRRFQFFKNVFFCCFVAPRWQVRD